MFTRARILTWFSALAALFLIVGAPWAVYATAARTQSVAAPIEEERDEHVEHDEKEVGERATPPPPRAPSPSRVVAAVQLGAVSKLSRPTPACPSVFHPARLSVRRLI